MAKPIQQALRAMGEVVGENYVFSDPTTLEEYSLNMLTVENIVPASVVKPASVEEIQEILSVFFFLKITRWAKSWLWDGLRCQAGECYS